MRLVLDTNVVLSALLWGGMPYQLLCRIYGVRHDYTSAVFDRPRATA